MVREGVLCGLTFELSWHRRWDARARLARMYRVPPTWPVWPAVGAQLERGVRRHLAMVPVAEPFGVRPSVLPASRLLLRLGDQ